MTKESCQNCRWWMYEDEQMEWNPNQLFRNTKGFA